MREEINENIQASRSYYDGYLLLDSQGDSLFVSTADNMLAPTDFMFELDNLSLIRTLNNFKAESPRTFRL